MTSGMSREREDKRLPGIQDSDGAVVTGWQLIETAPKGGTHFLALLGGLPYEAKYDEYDKFIWYTHSDHATGPVYRIHEIDGKRLLEETEPKGAPKFKITGLSWRTGFEKSPTHWAPLPEPQDPAE